MSIIFRLPQEILENIIIQLVLIHPLASPSHSIPFLLSCKYFHSILAFGNSHSLWARLFTIKFDLGAANRRFGDRALWSPNLATQLQSYCINLQRIRSGDIFSPHILDIFWTTFIMLTENDGKNMCHLQQAGLDDFVDRFVRTRLGESRLDHNGWPAENDVNALALWIFWMTSTRGQFLFFFQVHSVYSSQINYSPSRRRDGSKSSTSYSHMFFFPFAYVFSIHTQINFPPHCHPKVSISASTA